MEKIFIKGVNDCFVLNNQEKEIIKRRYFQRKKQDVEILQNVKKNTELTAIYESISEDEEINYFFNINFGGSNNAIEYFKAAANNKYISLLNLFEILTLKRCNTEIYENIFKNPQYHKLMHKIKFASNCKENDIEEIIIKGDILLIQTVLFNKNT